MRLPRWTLLVILVIVLVPWLGLVLFNTKGEPREAIVAVSMLQSGDWILPTSHGGDIPYKPPFLAWLIALLAKYLNGGHVTEFLSRLPSALAAIAMIMGGYSWARRYVSAGMAAAMALVTLTSFEVFRAAVCCRVDMVLTACMVLASYQMYYWRETGREGSPWHSRGRCLHFAWGTLLLSGAVLAKGPVGALLPCLCMGIFCLIRGDNFFKSAGWLSLMCVLSLILPALWYYQAYQLGGDHFLQLAYEENIGRLTGNMGYESHLNPWYYNIITVVAGMLPWTLFALLVGVGAAFHPKAGRKMREAAKSLRQRITSYSSPDMFALTMALVVFLFYCLPASKRSVYLLPMYPFMAYAVAYLLLKLRSARVAIIYTSFIEMLAVAAPIVMIIAQWLPLKHPMSHIDWWAYPFALLPVVTVFAMRHWHFEPLVRLLSATLAMYLAYAAAFAPMVLNGKSDYPAAAVVLAADKENGPTYGYIEADSLMRYYTINFYIGDRLRLYPEDGSPIDAHHFNVLASPTDMRTVVDAQRAYSVDTMMLTKKSCDTRRPLMLGKFKRR